MRPRIAVLMDENTSAGGTRYEAHKGYFRGLAAGGGAPYGVPYAAEMVAGVIAEFDGLLAAGGRFAYPAEFYVDGRAAPSPSSERFDVERALMTGFLATDKPVLGICAGMQMLACLHGGKLTADIAAFNPAALPHDGPSFLHAVHIQEGTRLRQIIGVPELQVNSFHREAVVATGAGLRVSARAEDGIVEAVELGAHRFALGIQWHQELFAGSEHAGNQIFAAFVQACGARAP